MPIVQVTGDVGFRANSWALKHVCKARKLGHAWIFCTVNAWVVAWFELCHISSFRGCALGDINNQVITPSELAVFTTWRPHQGRART